MKIGDPIATFMEFVNNLIEAAEKYWPFCAGIALLLILFIFYRIIATSI